MWESTKPAYQFKGLIHDSRSFLKVGESQVEIKDYKIATFSNGDTEITVIIDGKTTLFEATFLNVE